MTSEKTFVTIVRENVHKYGPWRSFTFIQEGSGGKRTYQEIALDFDELDRRARSVAVWLQELDQQDRPVLLLYPEGLDFLCSFVGCLYGRVIAVPAPLPELSPQALERAHRIITDTEATLLLTDSAHHHMLTEWLETVGLAGQVRCVATDTGLDADPDLWSMPEIVPDTPAFLQYTSGSTSVPKGVIVSHGNLLHNEMEISRLFNTTPDEILVGWLPHHHDMGLVGLLMHPLFGGWNTFFMSSLTFIRRPVLWLELISRYRATVTVAPNFSYQLLLRRVTDEQVAGLDLTPWRIAVTGAEPVRAETLEEMVERFGHIGFSSEAWMPCYGMAESTLLVAGAPAAAAPVIGEFDAAALTRDEAVRCTDAGGRRLVSCGQPVSMTVRIVAPDTRAVVPDGRVGEIWVRGGSVGQGYWQRPVATRETFRGFTAEGDGPYLRTGDLGFRLDGELFITGRIKDLIIVNGHNTYAHDIELRAQQAHPSARGVAAFTLDDAGGEVVIVQEIRPVALGGTALPDLATEIRDVVARSFGLPTVSVVLTTPGSVRLTTSGKVQRGLTRRALLAGEIRVLAADLTMRATGLITSPTAAGIG